MKGSYPHKNMPDIGERIDQIRMEKTTGIDSRGKILLQEAKLATTLFIY